MVMNDWNLIDNTTLTARQIKLRLVVETAVSSFNLCEEYLLKNDLSERCICAKFAQHLEHAIAESQFCGYTVDVEYNRGSKGKDYLPKVLTGADGEKRIVVDLIVHERGYHENFGFSNLICIEMKKSTDRRGCVEDEKRLRIMTDTTHGFGYKIGFMLVADMKQQVLKINQEYKRR